MIPSGAIRKGFEPGGIFIVFLTKKVIKISGIDIFTVSAL